MMNWRQWLNAGPISVTLNTTATSVAQSVSNNQLIIIQLTLIHYFYKFKLLTAFLTHQTSSILFVFKRLISLLIE